MGSLDPNAIALMLYRLASMGVGLALAWMGYRMFLSGWFEKAGDLKAAWGPNHLELKQAAPGTVYAVLGAVVIVTSLLKGFSVRSPGSGVVLVGTDSRTPVVSTWGMFGSGAEEYAMMEIARRAVLGDSISQAERLQFMKWYETSWRGMRREVLESVTVTSEPLRPSDTASVRRRR